jgi:hypothetical protein
MSATVVSWKDFPASDFKALDAETLNGQLLIHPRKRCRFPALTNPALAQHDSIVPEPF